MAYHLILNERYITGKKSKSLLKVQAVFDKAGKNLEIHPTTHIGHAKEIAREISALDGEQTIVAMGGDGILHEIVNGVEDFEKCAVGIIPFGTGNDFAAAAAIPKKVEKAAEIIAYGTPKYIDYIELSSGLRSINAVGMGIDVDVLKRAYAGKNQGKSKYFFALLKSLIKFKSYEFTAEYDGVSEKHFGLIAAIGNGKQIGGGIKLFPDAKIDDGKLDVLIVDYISKFKMILAFLKLMRGKINKIKEVTAVRVKSVKFIPASENYTIQAEGELYENLPLDAHIVENKLKFYVP